MGKSAFNVPCTLVKNKYSFNTAALCNTRANTFLLIDKALAALLIKHCKITVYNFNCSIPVNKFNKLSKKPIIS